MLARNVSMATIQKAAAEVELGVIEARPVGKGWRFRLEPLGVKRGSSKKYQLVRSNPFGGKGFGARGDGRRNVHAVCWHGFRQFFRAVFALEPGARFQTGQTRLAVPGGWYTATNFEAEHEKTDRNIGSQMYPLYYSDACDCGEKGLL